MAQRALKIHQIIVTVRFDKKCSRKRALADVRDCIHGEFYTTAYDDADPESFRVRSMKLVPLPTKPGPVYGDDGEFMGHPL